MANRIPLIVNPSASQIQELPAGDTLDLSNCTIASDAITVSGNLTVSGNIIGNAIDRHVVRSTIISSIIDI
jgi:Leucine-rich repeat (LRR) protein